MMRSRSSGVSSCVGFVAGPRRKTTASVGAAGRGLETIRPHRAGRAAPAPDPESAGVWRVVASLAEGHPTPP